MDKKIKDFITGLAITVFITLLFGYIIYRNAIFIPHLTTFSITILAIKGSLFYWTLKSYNLKTALLIQLLLLMAFLVIFKDSVSINFIIFSAFCSHNYFPIITHSINNTFHSSVINFSAS